MARFRALFSWKRYKEFRTKKYIAFRNYLRTHKEDREKYSVIKLQAAIKYPTDIDSYIETKSPCITEIYKKCGL
ncbi:GrpB family protein [Clostridium tagluense]|uniref:GrpB family protein n=1 Tax=Clostridium tagluense TaxID=360422 RepID=UPI002277E812|nr:GrpB family protein [Clostridium tagluense]